MFPRHRRFLPPLIILFASALAGSAGAEVRITGIVDGDLSGGAPKAIELYVSGTEDLGFYELWRSSNGGDFAFREVLPSATFTDEFVYLVGTAGNGRADFEAVFGTAGDFANIALESGNISGNGNDGFQVRDAGSGATLDQVWTNDGADAYTDSYLYRIDGTGPDGGWTPASWSIPGNGILDGMTAAEMGSTVPFGTYVPGGGGAGPYLAGSDPASGAADVPVETDLTLTFSEAVDVTGVWAQLTCGTQIQMVGSGLAVSGGPVSYILDPDSDLPLGTACTLEVFADQVAAQDDGANMDADARIDFVTIDAQEICGAPFTPVYDIQGDGESSPLAGTEVSTEGVVVGDFEGDTSDHLRGFYLQDPAGDGDGTTSDGIFVYTGGGDQVANGDRVRVKGMVQEWFGETQISSLDSLLLCDTGAPLPLVQIDQMPFPEATGGIHYLERFEGMHVYFPQTLFVTEMYQLGRFGQLTLSAGARLRQFTDGHAPDPDGYSAHLEAVDRNHIILDDTLQTQNPDPIIYPFPELTAEPDGTVRGGMTVTGLRGLLTYTWNGTQSGSNAFRLRPISGAEEDIPLFAADANPRPLDPPAIGGTLRIVSYNVQNYFTTLAGSGSACDGEACCGPDLDQQCRGAWDAEELDRQTAKTVSAILAMDADVYALTELENNGTDSASAIGFLVQALNEAAGETAFAAVQLPAERLAPISGKGFVDVSDVISAGFIYKTGSVRPAPGTAVAVLDDAAATSLPVAGEIEFPLFDGFATNRASLAASFEEIATGEVFTVVVNHFKSKGSSDKDLDPVCESDPAADPNCDQGDGQGYWNARRTDASRAVASWIEQDPTGSGDSDYLIVGDLNSYAKEDPITELVADWGYTDLTDAFIEDPYSYVFDGQWGYLDYGLAKGEMLERVTDVAEWHNNADEPSVLGYSTAFKSDRQISLLFSPEPYRTSDHDPLIIGVDLTIEPLVPGDLNGDGRVNWIDWILLRAALGTSEGDPGFLPEADYDNDGRITWNDARIWIGYWQASQA